MTNREKLLEQLKKLEGAFPDPLGDNEIIYHYTSAEGLRGIIMSDEIWLTNTAFVNDTTECKMLQKISDMFRDGDFSNKYVEKRWKPFVQDSDERNSHYIASFSKVKDSLEQWRAYGNFCIGFEAKKLVNHPFNLYECVYSPQEIKDWILAKSNIDEWQGDCLDEIAKGMAAFEVLYTASMKYKNAAYKAEKEVRLITLSNYEWHHPSNPSIYKKDPPIHFRVCTAYKMPVPYVKFFVSKDDNKEKKQEDAKETFIQMQERKLREEENKKRERLPIKEIIIGPMLLQKEAKLAFNILLKAKGYEGVDINVSDIPYRGK